MSRGHEIYEVKQGLAMLVIGWVTAWCKYYKKQGPKRHKPWPIQKFKQFKTIEDIAVSQSEIFRKFQKVSEVFRNFQKD